jgi:hypothetical protein
VIRLFSQAKGEEQEQQDSCDQNRQAYGKRTAPRADAELFDIGIG